jgi:hypothetical protein
MRFKKGDLVRGTRPWNAAAHHGVILETKTTKQKSTGLEIDSFRVHWFSPVGTPSKYTTWEVNTSLVEADSRL